MNEKAYRRFPEEGANVVVLDPDIPQSALILPWRSCHYRALLKVGDPTARAFYLEETVQGDWSVRRLESQIQARVFAQHAGAGERTLSPRQGRLYTYRLLAAGRRPRLDLGFGVYHAGAIPGAEGVGAEGIAEVVRDGAPDRVSYRLTPSALGRQALYTYQAVVERVVDGDFFDSGMDPTHKNTSSGERHSLYLPVQMRVVADGRLCHAQHFSHPMRFGSKCRLSENSTQPFRNLSNMRIRQRETDHTETVVNRHFAPKVGLINRQKSGIGLLPKQARNRVVFNHCSGAQVGDKAHQATVPVAKRCFKIAPHELFVQHQHQTDSSSGKVFKKPDITIWTASITASWETRPR